MPGYAFRRDEVSPLALPRAVADPPSGEGPLALVRSALERALGALPDLYSDEVSFAELGIDSISATRLCNELGGTYPDLDIFALFEFDTAAALAGHLSGLEVRASSAAPPAPTDGPDEVGDIGTLTFGPTTVPIAAYLAAHRRWAPEGPAIEVEQIDVGGTRIECLVCGEGPAVVLLPPFNATGIIWIQQLVALSGQYRLVVPHYPGLAGSDWVEGLDRFEEVAALLVGAVDGLADRGVLPARRVHWVGWSLGGFLAQTVCRHHRDSVDKVVLVSTTTISWSSEEYTVSGEEFSRLCAEEFADNAHELPPFLLGMPEIEALRREGRLEHFVVGTTDRKVIHSYFRMIARFRNRDMAPHIDAETLLISGAQDVLMPARFARELSERIRGARYREIPGRHFLSLFRADAVNSELRSWFDV